MECITVAAACVEIGRVAPKGRDIEGQGERSEPWDDHPKKIRSPNGAAYRQHRIMTIYRAPSGLHPFLSPLTQAAGTCGYRPGLSYLAPLNRGHGSKLAHHRISRPDESLGVERRLGF